MSNASGNQGLWTEPKYPGDTVRVQLMRRGDELGQVCIQAYNARSFRVGSFLPGENRAHEGDTPKMEPERSCFKATTYAANEAFDEYVQLAYADFWQNYNPEGK